MVCVWPFAAATAFGRLPPLYLMGAHLYALVPGLVGDYLRIAYYHLTLTQCSLESRISFGSFFAHPDCRVGPGVYIGAYNVIGRCEIGARSQIASGVQILSGRRQHARDAEGHILGADETAFTRVTIGPDCWLGAAAIIMADIGAGTTIGAGAVVTKPIPARVVAVGNPARVREPGEAR